MPDDGEVELLPGGCLVPAAAHARATQIVVDAIDGWTIIAGTRPSGSASSKSPRARAHCSSTR
ncbi:hypothetical protein [Microbacterium cremeum]|uniref:hypothetical protein n=1 Tax=Microbacterium cremeum TaxID=2782169 RepID=UPI001888A936|nr:hypothetical protein [Microbacterium cremeum]